jgi:hypothetical protein
MAKKPNDSLRHYLDTKITEFLKQDVAEASRHRLEMGLFSFSILVGFIFNMLTNTLDTVVRLIIQRSLGIESDKVTESSPYLIYAIIILAAGGLATIFVLYIMMNASNRRREAAERLGKHIKKLEEKERV